MCQCCCNCNQVYGPIKIERPPVLFTPELLERLSKIKLSPEEIERFNVQPLIDKTPGL